MVEESGLGGRGHGGWWDGMSITRDGIIFYAPTPDSKRENFTLCHELAHFLVDEDSDEATADWAADLHNRDKVIEDVCDIVAQRLLIPDDLVRRTVAEHGVTGSALAHLFATSEASRQACAVALAQRLGGDGFVAIADMRESVVTFASRAHKGYPFPAATLQSPAGTRYSASAPEKPAPRSRGGGTMTVPLAPTTSTPSASAIGPTPCSPLTISGTWPNSTRRQSCARGSSGPSTTSPATAGTGNRSGLSLPGVSPDQLPAVR